MLEGIRTAGTVIGDGFSNFITNYKEVGTTIGAVSLLALGVYAARFAARLTFASHPTRTAAVARKWRRSTLPRA